MAFATASAVAGSPYAVVEEGTVTAVAPAAPVAASPGAGVVTSQVAVAAGGQSSGVLIRAVGAEWIVFGLVVTGDVIGAGDSLDVWVQQSWDGGKNWDDVCRFAAVTNALNNCVQFAQLPVFEGLAAGHWVQSDGALGAASVAVRVLGRLFRAKWTVTNASGTAAVTFQVMVFPRALRE